VIVPILSMATIGFESYGQTSGKEATCL